MISRSAIASAICAMAVAASVVFVASGQRKFEMPEVAMWMLVLGVVAGTAALATGMVHATRRHWLIAAAFVAIGAVCLVIAIPELHALYGWVTGDHAGGPIK